MDTADDAGIYKLSDDLALVQTVDFFTPIVDDPYMYGQIAAANALSDVYAMGGKPVTALNIVGFPISKVEKRILAEILRGAADKLQEAEVTLLGGHSIDDEEPKFGMAVTGLIHPAKIWTNAGACPGDLLILTKPIGIGVLTTAIKREKLDQESIEQVMKLMATLNRETAEIARRYPVHAATDVTGFGLLGHASEMARGSSVGMEIAFSRVPILPKTRELAEQQVFPGGSKANYRWLRDKVDYEREIDETDRLILSDAVTSGGLLLSLPPEEGWKMVKEMNRQGIGAVAIGRVVSEHPGIIHVVKELTL
ncbi:Selenide, water dikinase [[Clostridium] ultunense Esp]|nr:Selenide, water dikinase [[Clostridium] ultunense Esp]